MRARCYLSRTITTLSTKWQPASGTSTTAVSTTSRVRTKSTSATQKPKFPKTGTGPHASHQGAYMRISIAMMVLVLGVTGCTRRETDAAVRETKEEAREAGRDIRDGS